MSVTVYVIKLDENEKCQKEIYFDLEIYVSLAQAKILEKSAKIDVMKNGIMYNLYSYALSCEEPLITKKFGAAL